MLDENRIKEAASNIKAYMNEGMLKRVDAPDPMVKNVFVNNSRESLKVAELLFKNNHSNLWTIVCSYYSMYYIANAVLYRHGYKVGEKISHKITADALIVYIRDKLKKFLLQEYEDALNEALELAGIKSDEIIASFDDERIKRSKVQYNTTEQVKRTKAQTSLDRAKNFVFDMEKLLV